MTHKMIVDTAKGIAAAACEMKFKDRTGGAGANRRFRRIWQAKNKALYEAFKIEHGYYPSPEELFGELNWTDYVEDARTSLAKILGQEEIRSEIKDKIAEALISDRKQEYAAPAKQMKSGTPPALIMNPDHPGAIERSLFGDH